MLSALDFVLLHLGSPGRYQLFIGFLLCCLQIPISFSSQLWKYYAEEPPHRCLVLSELTNGTRESEWIPIEENGRVAKKFSACSMYIDVHNHWKGTQQCINGWEYKPFEREHNVIMEWNLVCERKYMSTLLFYTSHIFAILGALLFASLSDRFERKRILLLALYLFVSVALAIHFVQDFITFAILYCLQMFFVSVSNCFVKCSLSLNSFQGIFLISYVLLIEIFPTPYQLQASLYFVTFAIMSTTLFPLFMWIIRTWRYVQLALVAPGIVILPQSPLWLINEGRVHNAANLIENLAAQNGKTMPPSFRLHLQNLHNQLKNTNEPRHHILPKFSSPCVRWYLLVHFYLHFVASLTTNVSESQVLRLHESKYVDHFFRGLVDLGTVMLLYYFAVRLGPRPAQSLIFILSGLLLMAAISLQEMLPKHGDFSGNCQSLMHHRRLRLPSAAVTVDVGFRRANTAENTSSIHLVSCREDTSDRNTGFACCFSWSIIAEMAAPNLLVLADLIAPFVPIGLCGSLSVIAGALSLLFPNCWRKPLPNNLEEAENRRLIPVKERYPSFRQLKNGKVVTLVSSAPLTQSNVYTIDPVSEKTDVKLKEAYCQQSGQNYSQRQQSGQTQRAEQAIGSSRPSGLYDDNDSKLSDLEEFTHSNWRLYSNEMQPQPVYKTSDSRDVNRSFRDLHVFPRPKESQVRNVPLIASGGRDTSIAETNL
ncbi:organic anion transporter-like protein [Leptotrombidium deliense]|uniref:Organic anion transporter-like protein n=1 Tax=Leptotrombidium deliense TaxID=299467 RepID=A0A443SJB1_9ACAR|nr:organic anion transporter-like protein [Leptotrombidium deliense]